MSNRGGRSEDLSTALFEQHRGQLFGVAYGMLGSTADAEDIVQDAFLRWRSVEPSTVDSPVAYLTTITTRLAMDHLRSARVRRETYVGPWLPEPIVRTNDDPAAVVTMAEQISVAMLTTLERLNPVERAVLLLRDVFDLDYAEIADIVDKSPANTRQIAVRARDRVGDAARSRPVASEVEQRLLHGYLAAISSGDLDALAEVFAEDVVLWSDGGGKVRAARHLLNGAWRVARHLIGVSSQTPPDTEVSVVRVNGEPGFMGSVDGAPIGIVSFDIRDERIVGVHAFLNPDKLAGVAVDGTSQSLR
jgi:RNA polymerase sigma-70 factor (ECF subfamily)